MREEPTVERQDPAQPEPASPLPDAQGAQSLGAPSEGDNPSKNNEPTSNQGFNSGRLVSVGAWTVALCSLLLVGYLALHMRSNAAAATPPPSINSGDSSSGSASAALQEGQPARFQDSGAQMPDYQPLDTSEGILRRTNLHTIFPTRPREDVFTYTVQTGDSVFSIAKDNNLNPESVLWANYDTLKDSPDSLSPGMVLKIPPANGVYYTWKDGDTLDSVANQFSASAKDILNWSGNHLDLTNPQPVAGQEILIPGGKREFVRWVIPTIPRGQAGVSKNLLGPGACDGGYSGAYGSGAFIWPSSQHVLSGNNYWSGHLGIDIAGSLGDGIYAADSGVVVFAGWAYGGYGNMTMIDHGNGYQTLYAHQSAISVSCGQSVSRGQYIGAIGSTGNSTGPHLHFEVRYEGGWISPWFALPAP